MGAPAEIGLEASGKSPYSRDTANGVIQGELSAVGPSKVFAFYGTLNLFIWGEYNTELTTAAGDADATVASAGAIAAGASVSGENIPPGCTVGSIAGTDIVLAFPTYSFRAGSISGDDELTDIQDTTWLIGAAVSGLGLDGTEVVDAIVTASVQPNAAGQGGVKGVVQLDSAPDTNPPSNAPTPFDFALAEDCVAAGVDADAIFTGAAIGLTGVVQLERSFDGGTTWVVCNIGGTGQLAQWNMTAPVSIAFGEPERNILYRLNVVSLTPSAGTTVKYRLSATGQAATTLSVQTL